MKRGWIFGARHAWVPRLDLAADDFRHAGSVVAIGRRRLGRGELRLATINQNAHLVARAATSITAWPVSFLGVTAEYQSAGDGEILGPSEQFTLLSAGPSLRTWSGRLYFQVDTLVGFGHGYSHGSDDFLDGTQRVSLHGPAFTLAAAAYWHPAFLELGPVVELTVYDGAALCTLGFGLGVAL